MFEGIKTIGNKLFNAIFTALNSKTKFQLHCVRHLK